MIAPGHERAYTTKASNFCLGRKAVFRVRTANFCFWLQAEVGRHPFKVRCWMRSGRWDVRFRSIPTDEASGTVEGQSIDHRLFEANMVQVHTRARRSYTGQNSDFATFLAHKTPSETLFGRFTWCITIFQQGVAGTHRNRGVGRERMMGWGMM